MVILLSVSPDVSDYFVYVVKNKKKKVFYAQVSREIQCQRSFCVTSIFKDRKHRTNGARLLLQ